MMAVSLWQPWASGVALGLKANETRSRRTSHRGELAIHAAKHWKVDQRSFVETERAAGTIGYGLPFGAIVAVVDLLDVHSADKLAPFLSDLELRWGDYGPNRWAWRLRNVRPLAKPVPTPGRQMLWRLDEETERKVRSELSKVPAHDPH